jgi:signal transduction histidine kinase
MWQCPHMLFPIMGVFIMIAITVTYFVGQRYADPLVVVVILFTLTAVLFVISYIVLNSFERIATASKEKSEFISLMSHELRNPLSSIKWQLDLLLHRESTTLDPGEEKKAIEAIAEQNERMIGLINELLELNRLESGEMILKPSQFLIGNLIRESVSKHTKRAAFSNIDLVFFPSEKDIEVLADQQKVLDVLGYILDNAIRYSHSGTKITIVLEKANREARCAISDEYFRR